MEQLAHFVTKSFEYNNNRVLDVINMATKSLMCENIKSSDSSDNLSNGGETDIDDDADTVDIDITDMSSNDETTITTMIRRDNIQQSISNVMDTPISLIKKSNRDNVRNTTKNWLISDTAISTRRNEGSQYFDYLFESTHSGFFEDMTCRGDELVPQNKE